MAWRRYLLALILTPVAALGLILWLTLPPTHATLRIAGLSAPVSIDIDQYGVPRIHAATEQDAAAALGYMHARDRMFQMELTRRAAAGRLAELFGPRAVPVDRLARILGEYQHAESSYAALSPQLKAILVAYSAGVNGWIAERGRLAAPEFLALGAPEPWKPVDCLLWSETVSLWLSDNYHTELARAALQAHLPLARIFQLWPDENSVAAPDSTTPPAPAIRQGLLDHLPSWPAPFTWPAEESDAWAIDGHHTATGAPLLAGDPHLALGFPSLWYLARIETPGAVLAGATAPGVPFLIIGHNAHIAWTFTNTGIDTQDVFVETPLPHGMYATPDGPRPYDVRREVIHVRGAPDVVIMARATRHGPVIAGPFTDMGGTPSPKPVAVAMMALRLPSAAPGLYALNLATNVAQAGQAAAQMTAPMQNLTVADHDSIAMFTTGAAPIRRAGDGSLPVDGADGLHDWIGIARGDALPHDVAPASGTVENANERTAPPDFPVFLGRDFPAPLRARRIHQLLAARSRFSLDDMQAMQVDDVSLLARDLLPDFAALPRASGLPGQAQALLAHWDGAMRANTPQPLIFNAAIQLFVARIYAANHVPEDDAGPWDGFVEWLLHDPAATLWCAGDCHRMLAQALGQAVTHLASLYGDDPLAWRWGSAHKAIFAHPILGDLPLIGRLASRRVAISGDGSTLFRGANGELGDCTATHGAAYRGAYDLADLDRSRFIVTPGQSGNFLSPHAWDLLPLWAHGQLIGIAGVAGSREASVLLEPK